MDIDEQKLYEIADEIEDAIDSVQLFEDKGSEYLNDYGAFSFWKKYGQYAYAYGVMGYYYHKIKKCLWSEDPLKELDKLSSQIWRDLQKSQKKLTENLTQPDGVIDDEKVTNLFEMTSRIDATSSLFKYVRDIECRLQS